MGRAKSSIASGWLLALACLALVGCERDAANSGVVEQRREVVGETGGTVALRENGASVDVPAGAVDGPVEIAVSQLAEETVAETPAGTTPVSPPIAFTPHGQRFLVPVTIALPYDASADGPLAVLRLDDERDTTWEVVRDARFAGGVASFESMTFSVLVVAEAPDLDAGPVESDAGPVEIDAGPLEIDAGPVESDAGPGPVESDAGSVDVDADVVEADAGAIALDAGAPLELDAGVTADVDAGACAPSESCNAVDDDCDGVIDEGACGMGGMDAGAPIALDDAGACTPSMEACDGDDDDCDGRVDESLLCSPSADAGACAPTESCNGVDDTCDGIVDEGCAGIDAGPPCMPADRRTVACGACGSGTQLAVCAPSGTWDVGPCMEGPCDDAGVSCMPGAVEACNGLDEDCDGRVDEGPSTCAPTDAGAPGLDGAVDLDAGPPGPQCMPNEMQTLACGACGTGTLVRLCNGDGQWLYGPCMEGPCDDGGAPGADAGPCMPGGVEACNGWDDDCDGAVDEGAMCLPVDAGAPGADGGGSACIPGAPEGCNGVDDDCDLRIDEGVPGCAGPDAGPCIPGGLESCNGADDDCDAIVDEGLSCLVDAGAPGVDGSVGGCDPAALERCNVADDDCDGRVDEGISCSDGGMSGECMPGAMQQIACGACGEQIRMCAPGGTWQYGPCLEGSCADGGLPSTDAGAACVPADEVCNAADDDCDARIDEGVSCLDAG